MRIPTFFTAVLFILLALSATDALAKDEIYRWVDENGVVHFGDQPEGQINAEKIDVPGSEGIVVQPSSSPGAADADPQPSYAQQRRDERAEKRRETAERQEVVDAACAQRRQLVAQLEPSTRVMATNEDGEVVRMDDNDRLEILGEAKAYIAENCGS